MAPIRSRSSARRSGAIALLAVAACARAQAYDWLQFNGDPGKSGNNVLEKTLGRANVGTLAFRWQAALPAEADGAPVFLRGVATPGGIRDLVFVTTRAGHLVALDATTGAQVWSQQHGPGTCRINNGTTVCYTTSSPAIDPNRQYVYSYGLDGFVHKHRVGDGVEITTGGWPQLATLKAYDEKGSSALAFATAGGATYLYVVHGGYPGDGGDYQGHVTAINLATGTQNVFNTMCSNQAVHLAHLDARCVAAARSALWSRAGVTYHAGTNRIYVATGNGSYNGNTGGFNWSESVLALNPDGTGAAGKPVDAYTPANFQALDNADADLGSTSPTVLPVPANSNVPHLAIQSGKDSLVGAGAKARLLNLANLSGTGGPGALGGEVGGTMFTLPQSGVVLSQPATWVNPADGATWAFVAHNNGLAGLRLQVDVNGNPSLTSPWSIATGGTSPHVANGVLYVARGGSIRAFDPTTGAQVWSNTQIGNLHWQSPVVHNGALYVTDRNSQLWSFAPSLLAARFGVDFDFDGRSDLVWRNDATGTALWLMNGTGATAASLVMPDPNWSVSRVADLSGDGKADIAWRNNVTGHTLVWLMNGLAATATATLMTDPNWSIVQVADFNGDNRTDLVWRNSSTGHTAIWLMNGTVASAASTVMTDPNWSVVQVGDFNADGKSDLVWRNSATGQTALWLMNGTAATGVSVVMTDPNWSVTRVGDFDGDGASDLVWRNASTGHTSVWLMNGTAATAVSTVMTDANWAVVNVGDFNADGKSDLAWRNGASGTSLWLMNGLSAVGASLVMPDAAWTLTHVNDTNGDAKADLVWRHTDGRTALWLVDGLGATAVATLSADPAWAVAGP